MSTSGRPSPQYKSSFETAHVVAATGGAVPTASQIQSGDFMCTVCECEPAYGNHYGAFTCNSCRDFFKRAVALDTEFECAFDENCPINRKENRRKCRRCCLVRKCRFFCSLG